MKKTILFLFASWFMLTGAPVQAAELALGSGGNGQSGSSKTASRQEEKMVEVYPNPSSGVINLSLEGFGSKKVELRIINVIGNAVYTETLNEMDNRFTRSYDLSNFAKGLYYIKLESDGFSEMKKVIIR